MSATETKPDHAPRAGSDSRLSMNEAKYAGGSKQPDERDVPSEKAKQLDGNTGAASDAKQSTEESTAAPPYTIFTRHQKWMILTVITIAATFSGISANIYFPAIPAIASDLSVSEEDVTLTVTTYMIFQGISPSFWGALADAKGRRIAYICTFVVYIGACIGLAETKQYYQLVILRCLQSTGSASTIAIGAGVVGDFTTREERGGYMGIFGGGLLAPTAIGPVLGGALAGSLGWRAIFWFLTIYASSFLLILVFSLPETLRSLVGNGSGKPRGLAKSPLSYTQRRRLSQRDSHLGQHPSDTADNADKANASSTKSRINIFSSLQILFEKEVVLLILFLSLNYTAWQMTIASMSTLFIRTYHLTTIQLGLSFIGNGVGCVLGTFLAGRFLDWDYSRIKDRFQRTHPNASHAEFPIEYARLRTLPLYAVVEIASILVFGWTIDHHIHISAPIIAVFFVGWSSTCIQNVINTLLVDLFPNKGASATAALNLARCLIGAGGTAMVLPVAGAIGIGWVFTIVAAVLACALGLLVVQVRYGPRWRKAREEKSLE